MGATEDYGVPLSSSEVWLIPLRVELWRGEWDE